MNLSILYRFRKGHKQFNTGRTWIKKGQHIGLQTEFKKGQIGMRDEKHSHWMGDKVSYSALHTWVTKKLGRSLVCSECGKIVNNSKQIHWANIDHKYRRNLNDYIRLCVKCHKKYDIENGFYTTSNQYTYGI